MGTKKRLSVVMITKNEASLLTDCLASVAWADEIIVLDSGSEDETRALAQQLGQKFTATSIGPVTVNSGNSLNNMPAATIF